MTTAPPEQSRPNRRVRCCTAGPGNPARPLPALRALSRGRSGPPARREPGRLRRATGLRQRCCGIRRRAATTSTRRSPSGRPRPAPRRAGRPAGFLVSRSTRSHPAAQAGQQGVCAKGGECVGTRTFARWSSDCSIASPNKGEFEVVENFAYPLPVAVICRLLGVPLDDEPQFSRASALLAQALDPFSTITGVPPDLANERNRPGRGCADISTV